MNTHTLTHTLTRTHSHSHTHTHIQEGWDNKSWASVVSHKLFQPQVEILLAFKNQHNELQESFPKIMEKVVPIQINGHSQMPPVWKHDL